MHLCDKNRLKYLKDLDLLNTSLNTDFDELTELASQICQMPICVLSFFGDLNIYCKSAYGVPRAKILVSNSICQNLMSNNLETLVINDMSEFDYSDQNISKTEFDFEFYAGVKLETTTGIILGTLCVLDKKPNQISGKKLKYLKTIAKQITKIIELKSAEIDSKIKSDKLEKNANLYHDFIEKTPVDGILWEADVETFQNTYVSPQTEQILGFTSNQWIEEEDFWENHIHPEDRDWAIDFCKNEVKHRRNHIFTYRMLTKNGGYKWIQDRVQVFKNENQKLYLRGIMLDVTQQKNNEIQLSYEQIFNRDIIKNLPSILFLIDENQKFVRWNDKLEIVSGYSSDEIKKMKPLDFFNINSQEVIQKHIKKIKSKGQTAVEADLFTKSGELIPHQFSATTIKYKEKFCIIGSAVNVSEKAFQSKIENAESKLLTGVLKEDANLKTCLNNYLLDLENIFSGMHIGIQNIRDGKIFPLVSPSMPKSYIDKLYEIPIGKDVGSCGTAAYFGKTIIVKNIESHPLWEKYKDFILSFGYKSCWSTPIFNENGKVIATFAMYYKTPKTPSQKQLKYFKRNASLLSVIFQNDERQNQIKENLEVYKYVNLATKDVIYNWNVKQNFIKWSDSFKILFGYKTTENQSTAEEYLNIVHPEDIVNVEEATAKAIKNPHVDRWHMFYKLKTSQGYANVECHGYINRDKDGKATRVIGIVRDVTRQKQAEDRRRILESAIENSTDATIITEAKTAANPKPKIIYTNKAFTEITGYTASDTLGKTPKILQGELTNKNELTKLKKNLSIYKPSELTVINYKKNGEAFWNNFKVNPIQNSNGQFTHWVSTMRDVTKQKQREISDLITIDISKIFNKTKTLKKALDKVLNHFSKLSDFHISEVWLTNPEQTKISLITSFSVNFNSKLFYESYDKELSFSKGQGLPGIVWEQKSIVTWLDVPNNENIVRKEASKIAKIKTLFGLPAIYNNEVVAVFIFGSKQDQINLKNLKFYLQGLQSTLGAELNRKKIEDNLNKVFATIPDIICVIDEAGQIKKMNKNGCKLLGFSEKELFNKPLQEFIYLDESVLEFDDMIKKSIQKNKIQCQNRFKTKAGDIIFLNWTLSYSKEDHQIYGVARNITERQKHILAIEAQNRTLKEIAWKQSHEVRAPLAKIMGLIDLVDSGAVSKDDVEDILPMITESAKSLDKIIHEIVERTQNFDDI